jgi:hypothetical protein
MRSGGLAIASLLAAAGCSQPLTETVVEVQTSDLEIGVDVDAIRVVVFDVSDGGSSQVYSTAPVGDGGGGDAVLCGTALGCVKPPVTVALVPGPTHPRDRVRVDVYALLKGQIVISESVSFSFVDGTRQRLVVVLGKSCLPSGHCAGPPPDLSAAASDLGAVDQGMPDLATPDLGMPADLSAPVPDLATGPDLAVGPDLSAPDDLLTVPQIDLLLPIDLTLTD